MRTSLNRKRARLLSAILPGMCALALAAEESAPSERSAAISRGRQIYLTGVPVKGVPLAASVGDPAMEVPASILKCVDCHGNDGRGKAEGGATPTSIRWEELSKPSTSGPAGRRRSAYSGKLLVRAIALGIDASGNRLDPAMPRYRLTHEQGADLVAYLEVLGQEADRWVEAFFQDYAEAFRSKSKTRLLAKFCLPLTFLTKTGPIVFQDEEHLSANLDALIRRYEQIEAVDWKYAIKYVRTIGSGIYLVEIEWQFFNARNELLYACDTGYVLAAEANGGAKVMAVIAHNEIERYEQALKRNKGG